MDGIYITAGLMGSSVLGFGWYAFKDQISPPFRQRLKRSVEGERVAMGYEDLAKMATRAVQEKMSPLARFAVENGESKKTDEDIGELKKSLMAAGYSSQSSVNLFLSGKVILSVLGPVFMIPFIAAFSLSLTKAAFVLFVGAAGGYFAPNMILSRLVKNRRLELYENFPDAVDLMRTCIEAGLSTDYAIARVGDEIRIRSAAMSDEFRKVSMERRAGSSRTAALAGLVERVGLPEVEALVGALIQAERFGTGIGDALKNFSDTLRTDRRMRAEETAAKIPTKILMPLILCIFPVLFVLVLAPPVYQAVQTLALPSADIGSP